MKKKKNLLFLQDGKAEVTVSHSCRFALWLQLLEHCV